VSLRFGRCVSCVHCTLFLRSLRLLRTCLRTFLASAAFAAFVTYFLACVALDRNHALDSQFLPMSGSYKSTPAQLVTDQVCCMQRWSQSVLIAAWTIPAVPVPVTVSISVSTTAAATTTTLTLATTWAHNNRHRRKPQDKEYLINLWSMFTPSMVFSCLLYGILVPVSTTTTKTLTLATTFAHNIIKGLTGVS